MADMSSPEPELTNVANTRGNTLYVYIVSGVAAVGGLLFGFDTAIISGAIEHVRAEFRLTALEAGWATTSLLVGCMLGAAAGGTISDRFGRKPVLLLAAAGYIVSAVFAGLPRTFTGLVIARFVGGLAVGISSMIAPMYIAEIAPARIRGTLVTLQQMAIVTGVLLANITSGLLVDIGKNNWRWMFASAALPSLLLLIALIAVPESPRWLAKRSRYDRAKAILARVGGRRHAESELQEIKTSLAGESGSALELFSPAVFPALVIGAILAILGQLSGINTVIYYAPSIFLKAGFPEASSATWATVLVGLTNFVSTVVSLAVIDKVGRRPLLMIGTAGMTISMALAGTCMTSAGVPLFAKIAIVLFYIASFAVGVGGVVWVVLSEIFPTKIRGLATSVAVFAVWGSCSLVSFTFLWLLEQFSERVFLIYSALSLVMFLFVFWVLPETRGRSLEDIERMWRGRKSVSPASPDDHK